MNVPPGKHAFDLGEHHLELIVLPESFTLIVIGDAGTRPTVVTGTRTHLSMARDLAVMPFDAQVSFDRLGAASPRLCRVAQTEGA